ncbi:relaxase/mobilization nuclease domain-containing protein [Phenylobacterium sp. J367]|uniref:relaxase/mobilization nuclease domain-containing protein n=1 Tax=Phenylobacterium sp. J367 TaxID=2898435 RepID=UPI00215133F1|nr:relaxase/mobilization nuclease domain-containing protein [Phenylobacterium sp. J367]MCR5879539.1 relaxase/mobilization nuclease domain-containing protein [Phenylobacterium sp. J367]
MTEFRTVAGFEDVWRPPVRTGARRPEEVLSGAGAGAVRARLRRIVRRAPEVMVKVTGRTRDAAHLAAHLSYITRNGELAAEDRDGFAVEGRREVADLARDWAAAELMDSRRRTGSPYSLHLILSMPAGTDAIRLRDAARAFAAEAFAAEREYVLVLHTDTPHPHVHLALRARSDDGRRLSPKKADLEAWRQGFARSLREHGIEAEATPRRARGVTRKAERGPLRRMRQRMEAGRAELGRVARDKIRQAAVLAFGGAPEPTPWEKQLALRQQRIRRLYLAQAKLLQASGDAADRSLGLAVEAFVRSLRPPDTERLALARELRAANARVRRQVDRTYGGKDRS